MCIICNAPTEAAMYQANRCLNSFSSASVEMRAAIDHMAKFRDMMTDRKRRAQYDRYHKQLTRILKDWNRSEQDRETPCVALDQTAKDV